MRIQAKNKMDLFAVSIWVYIITNTTLYIRTYTVHYIIELIALAFMCGIWLFTTKTKNIFKVHLVVFFYFASILCLIFPDFVSGNIGGILMGTHLFLPNMILFFLLSMGNRNKISPLIVKIPLWYGFAVSLQSLLLWGLTYIGIDVGGGYEIIEKNGNQLRFAYNYLLGLQSTIFHMNGHKLLRLNGYYLEPAKFAFFLCLPFFIAYFLHKETKKKTYLFIAIVCGLCLLLTFSRGGYISCIIAFGIYVVLKRQPPCQKTTYKDIALIIGSCAVIVGFIYIVFTLVNMVLQNGDTMNWLLWQFTFAENGKVTLLRTESSNFKEIVKFILKKPYGYGMTVLNHKGGSGDFNVANAFSFWLYAGGIPGILCISCILIWLVTNYAIPCIKSRSALENAFGAAFLAQTIFALSYGTWMTVDYLFVIGMMVILHRKGEKEFNENIDSSSNILLFNGSSQLGSLKI